MKTLAYCRAVCFLAPAPPPEAELDPDVAILPIADAAMIKRCSAKLPAHLPSPQPKEYMNCKPCDYEFPERFFVILSFTLGQPPGYVEPSTNAQLWLDTIYSRLKSVWRTTPLPSAHCTQLLLENRFRKASRTPFRLFTTLSACPGNSLP